jgi:hypothetical protein
MTKPLTPAPGSAANRTAMRLLTPPEHGPIPIPGAFGPRNRELMPADRVAAPRPVEMALHDRAQDQRELEGGGGVASRGTGDSRGPIGRLFDLLFRS